MVFISYAVANKTRAKRLVKAFEENHISYWIGPYSVKKGQDFAQEIVWAIKTCEYFVVLLSKESMQSSHVKKEVEFAIKYKKKIIPVKLYNLELTEVYEYLLSDIQMTEPPTPKNGGFTPVVEQCRLGEKAVNIQLSKKPLRDLTILKGDYQDNLDYFIKNNYKEVVNKTLFVMGMDKSSKLDITSSGGVLKYVIEYLKDVHNVDIKTLQEKVDEAKKAQLNKEIVETLNYEDSLIITVPTKYVDKHLNLLLIANSSKKDKENIDNIEGIDSRKVIISAFDRAMKEKYQTIFIGAMGTNGLSFPYQVVISEIINAYAHATRINSSISRLVCSIRESDMIKANISIDEIMDYIGTVTKFI